MVIKSVTIEEVLAKTPLLKEKDIAEFREWVEENHPLASEISDFEISLFLHSCHYDMDFAKKTLECCLSCYLNAPEFFTNYDLTEEKFAKTLNTQIIVPICSLPNGTTVVISKLMDSNPDNFFFNEIIKLSLAVQTLHAKEEGLTSGMEVISDASGSTFTHLTKVGFFSMKKLMTYVQEGAPVRIKKIHFVNAQPWMDRFFALMKTFLKKEYTNMIQIHTSFDTLYEYVPKQYLPVEYGGTQLDFKTLHENMKQKLHENQEILFQSEQKMRNYIEGKQKERSSKGFMARWRSWV